MANPLIKQTPAMVARVADKAVDKKFPIKIPPLFLQVNVIHYHVTVKVEHYRPLKAL